MILAPAAMTAEKDPREAAKKCLELNELDPESYRIGHTKARKIEFSIEEWFKYYWTLDYLNSKE